MKIFQAHENSEVLTCRVSVLGIFIPQSTPTRQRQEEDNRADPGRPRGPHHCDGSVISLENTLQAPAALEEVCEDFQLLPVPLPAPVQQCCSSKLDQVLTSIPLNILQSFPISFRIKSNFQCDRKAPYYWPLPVTHTLDGCSYPLLQASIIHRLLTALCHFGAFIPAPLSLQGNPSSPPFPDQFFLVFQTLVSWGELPWPPCVPLLPPRVQAPLVLPPGFLCYSTSSTNLPIEFFVYLLFSSLDDNLLESRRLF